MICLFFKFGQILKFLNLLIARSPKNPMETLATPDGRRQFQGDTHRFLQGHGITNHVVDSSSIEVNRRRRRAKSDGLDVRKLLSMLLRYAHGERQVWQVVKVPSVEAEDQRHLHRDLETLKQERASTMTRIEGLLSSQGLRVPSLTKLPEQLEALRLWDGSPIPPGLRRRVLRVYAHHTFLSEQIAAVEAERRAQLQA